MSYAQKGSHVKTKSGKKKKKARKQQNKIITYSRENIMHVILETYNKSISLRKT